MDKVRKKERGMVYTERNVVTYILDEADYTANRNLKNVTILEPAAGGGAFAKETIDRLFQSSRKFKFSFVDALRANVRFVELDRPTYQKFIVTLNDWIAEYADEQSLATELCTLHDFLTLPEPMKFDCIVGNPPYVRHELIKAKEKALYRKKFKTFQFRADLYVPFFEQSLSWLAPKGRLVFICSNRWLNNQYGKKLREMIATDFHLVSLVNIEKSSPFEDQVIAYPCITTISKDRPKKQITRVAESDAAKIDFDKLAFREIKSPSGASWDEMFVKYDMAHGALVGIREQGFTIGIGVATGADDVFILKEDNLNGIERSRLIPIIRSRDLSKDKMLWSRQYLVNPYDDHQLCNLDDFPHLKKYFQSRKAELVKRHTAKANPDRWYKTIDKVHPDLQQQPKLLLPDLTGNKLLFIDEGNFYPHHNIYYIAGRDLVSLKLVAALLMSVFVRDQLSKIGVRMNGGMPRFQAQVLKRIRIPEIDKFSKAFRNELVNAYETSDLKKINTLVNRYVADHGIHD